ncbi:hypothetical protein FIU86_11870 [Roseovarius sp. THAF9]|nr:hypothetical protein [Roseovarius sp. THAF9]QFT93540.1 hypothetical protein FIU86_11870 [Roseovarius sp. THAF9]
MRKFLISLQVGLIALLAITGAIASPDSRTACPLGDTVKIEDCEK